MTHDGYDVAEYRGVFRDYGTLTDVRRFLEERKLEVSQIDGSYPMMGPNGSAYGVQYVQQSIRFAAELGCPMVDTVDGAAETPGMNRKKGSSLRPSRASGVSAGKRLGTTRTHHPGPSLLPLRKAVTSCGVIPSLPGQKGHTFSGDETSGRRSRDRNSCGRRARSLAMITHSFVIGSCRRSDIVGCLVV